MPKTPPRPPPHPLRSSRLTRSSAPAPSLHPTTTNARTTTTSISTFRTTTTTTTTTTTSTTTRPVAAEYLNSPVSQDQLTEPDHGASRRRKRPPRPTPALPKKRKAIPKNEPSAATKRLRRSTVKISYAEPDSSDSLDDFLDTDYNQNGNLHQARGDHFCPDGNPRVRKKLKVSQSGATAREIRLNKVEKKLLEKKKDFSYPGNTLPYHIWRRIFECLASPLFDVDARLEDQIVTTRKLLKVGSLGKILYEPAMAALYKCPPILDQAAFRLLSRTLSQPPSTTLINYRPKVETLRIDVGTILYLKYGGSYMFLDDIVPYLPRLMDLELYHSLDKAPYRSLDATIRYRYPGNLLRVLGPLPDADEGQGDKTVPTKLQSWRWNARLTKDVVSLKQLKDIHLTTSFASLRKIAFVNYQLPSLSSGHPVPVLAEADARATADVAASIQALPHLEHLILESSTIADANLLRLLPRTLKHLELINCWEVTANDLAEFLQTHGSSLERLTLKHCISLSMGFLRVLEQACPNLTHLDMNLLYYKTHEHYSDADPLYDHLLKDDEIPRWPASIQSIEISYMRFESVAQAEILFRSLVASAPKMPNLRRLVLGAKMNVSFRERVQFRKTWVEKTTTVFQQVNSPPVSVRGPGAPDGLYSQDEESDSPNRPLESLRRKSKRRWGSPPSQAPTRRSTRSTRLGATPPPLSPGESDDSTGAQRNGSRASTLARQLQWSMREPPTPKHHDADDEDSGDEFTTSPQEQLRGDGVTSQDGAQDVGRVHGFCDVVQIEVDNQKPTEIKYSMDDFIDSPSSSASDTEWNGDESEEEDVIIE